MNDRFSTDDLPRKTGSATRTNPWPIDLAHVRPFRIADVEVRPAARELARPDRRELLEPLVMQVLVALANARGETLSRDDLIDACWGGRAVTDDAVNRVVSRLRALARTFGTFQVETITKVGYRLVETGEGTRASPEAAELPAGRASAGIDRRSLIAGAVVAAAAGGALLWQRPWRHRPPTEAVELFDRGELAQRQGFSGQERQAISFYEQALRIDRRYAAAWGALALAHTHLLEGYGDSEIAGVPSRLRSAARRALELDPNNADARLALLLVRPSFRNWGSLERELRGFDQQFPRHWLAPGRLAVLLFDVGRIDEGARLMKRVLDADPMLPVGQAFLANAFLNTDHLQEAEAILDDAQDRWAAHPALWSVRYKFLLFNGRPQSARAFVMDPAARPAGVTAEDAAPFARLAAAVDSGGAGAVQTSIDEFRQRATDDVQNVPMSASAFALLGRPDLTFAAWHRYLFNEGPFGRPAPIAPLTRRYTRELFSRPLVPLRSDARYADLLKRAELEDYWRLSRTRPDYRRTGFQS